MKKLSLLTLSVLLVLGAAAAPAEPGERDREAPRAGQHPRDFIPASARDAMSGTSDVHGAASTSAVSQPGNLSFHGANVMTAVVARTYFVGTKWSSVSFQKDKITGVDTFFQGYNGSTYAKAAREYVGANGIPTEQLTYQGHVIDTSTSLDPTTSNGQIPLLNYVCKQVQSGTFNVDPSGNQAIFLFSDLTRPTNGPFCAFHSAAQCGSVIVTYAFFYNFDSDPGCSVNDRTTGHSTALAGLGNTIAHETHEMRTDPLLNNWYDAQGNEVGDKCAWTFTTPYVLLSNGSKWRIQSEWSNNAYTAGTGAPNAYGQKACIN